MQCPVCKTTHLVMSERQGIEIDYCPQCRGVWLDRGELDKIIERSAVATPTSAHQAPPPPRQAPAPQQPYQPQQNYQQPQQPDYRPQQQDHRYQQHPDYYKKKKRESFLSDIFDF
jgi:uncharacterized protein